MASRFASRFLTRSTRVGAAGAFRSAGSKTRVTAAPARSTALFAQSRSFSAASASTASASRSQYIWAGVAAGAGLALYSYSSAEEKVDYDAVRAAIAELLEDDSHDDGSWGPILVRLAWHASGTFDKNTCTGGSDGATMRFSPECHHGANAGLALARTRLESVKRRFPGISYADLWTLAGAVAIEEMGGPKINWRPGRSDADSSKACPPDGRLPDAAQGQDHVRDVFYRMGFNDREIVALVGAHALGRCHTSRSGYSGPWTNAPTTFSNDYFVQLSERTWTVKKWSGPKQYEDESGMLMMLPADMALFEDPKFRAVVLEYAADEEAFFRDFASAFSRLMELGCKDLGGAGFVHQLFDLSSR